MSAYNFCLHSVCLIQNQSKKKEKNHTPFSIPTSTKKSYILSVPLLLLNQRKICQINRLLYYYLEKKTKLILKEKGNYHYNDGVIVLHIYEKNSAKKLALTSMQVCKKMRFVSKAQIKDSAKSINKRKTCFFATHCINKFLRRCALPQQFI